MSERPDQVAIPAAFIRGGTSKAIFFRKADLPADQAQWAAVFCAALGSPDPNGRQLNGMGGGLSSLSKICVVGPAQVEGADIEYTFAQVAIGEKAISMAGNCGNISSAVGAFAVDEGMVTRPDGTCSLNLFNTNTRKIIRETFDIRGGRAAVTGALSIPGVAGSGSPVKLEFLDPGGAATGVLSPTGRLVDVVEVAGLGAVRVSVVDAANLCIFAVAEDLGLSGTEMPAWLDGAREIHAALAAIVEQVQGLIRKNLGREGDAGFPRIGLIGFVSAPSDAKTLSGEPVGPDDAELTGRMFSSGQPHRALPLTAALCMAVASKIPGTVVHAVTRPATSGDAVRIASPSGVLTVTADVVERQDGWRAASASVFRTQRRLFDGHVYVKSQDLLADPDRPVVAFSMKASDE